jgi:hypothetical protein
MISGRSGLPKLRQSVRAMGSAPTHARLRQASATAMAAPCRGSSSQKRPLQSVLSAMNFSRRAAPSSQKRRTTAASPVRGAARCRRARCGRTGGRPTRGCRRSGEPEEREEVGLGGRRGRGEVDVVAVAGPRVVDAGALVDRRGVGEEVDGEVDEDLGALRGAARPRAGRSPAVARTTQRRVSVTRPTTTASRSHFAQMSSTRCLLAGAGDHHHALLRLREEDLVGGEVARAAGDGVEVELDAVARAGGHLHGAGGEPRGAHVLDALEHARSKISRHASRSSFSMKGSPTCTVGRLRSPRRRTRRSPWWRRGCRRGRCARPRRGSGCRRPRAAVEEPVGAGTRPKAIRR